MASGTDVDVIAAASVLLLGNLSDTAGMTSTLTRISAAATTSNFTKPFFITTHPAEELNNLTAFSKAGTSIPADCRMLL